MSTTAAQEKTSRTIVIGVPAGKPSFGDIPLDCIRASKTNPRKIFNDDRLQELAKSIQIQGVAQPILVRPMETIDGVTYFEIVAGERRFRASRIAEMGTVPAIVRELSDQTAYEIQVLENLQREDLHPLEEAEGFDVMMKQYHDTADQLAEKVGKSKAYIYASLKLCALEPGPRKAFYDGLLTKSTALLVARIPVKDLQVKCTAEIATGNRGVLSTRNAAEHIANNYMLQLAKAPFKPEDLDLCKKAGACSACPKRAGNQPIVFADVAADVCTDPVCFQAKKDAHGARIKKIAIESGRKVITGVEAKKILPYQYNRLEGYALLGDKNYADDKGRTYRQLLGEDSPHIALFENPYDGSLVEVVKLADIKTTLIEKGVGVRDLERRVESKAQEKSKEDKAKREREYRKQLFSEIHHSTLMVNLVDADLRLVACQLFDRLQSNMPSTKLVMDLHGWTEAMLSYPDRSGKLRAAVEAFTPAELNQFIRDCVLSCELDVNVYTATSKDEPANLLAYAARTEVDAKKIRSEIDAAAKAKSDLKKKSVDKKAAKAAPAKAPAVAATAKKPAAKKVVTPAPVFPATAETPSRHIAAWPFPTSSRPKPAPAASTDPIEAKPSTQEAA